MFTNLINDKVVDDETEENGSPFVVPEAGIGGALVAAGYVEEFF